MSALIESTWDSIISMDMKQNRKIHIAKSVDVSIIRINTCFCAKFASTERPVRMNGVGSSVEAV